MKSDDMFDKQLFALTTIIQTKLQIDSTIYSGNASGFYYTEVEDNTDEKGPHWVKIEKQWLITNRHVVFNKISGIEYLVDEFTFCLRTNDGLQIDWLPITIDKAELSKRMKLHTNNNVDVVAIDVSDILTKTMIENQDKGIMLSTALTNKNLPDNQPITIDVTSDVVVASYPKGFYDVENKFPIVKSGIIASAWGLKFNGNPIFEIDAQLFPGSSGGLVISKPTNIALFDQSMHYSTTKQFVFLGVYSGEYLWKEIEELEDGTQKVRERSYGLGNVWYSYLIPQIIGR